MKHSKLIQIVRQIYPEMDKKGVCTGYGFMAMQAIQVNDLAAFKRRLKLLDSLPMSLFCQLPDVVFDKTKLDAFNRRFCTKFKHKTLVDILAFLEGIAVYQQGHFMKALQRDCFFKPQNHYEDRLALLMPSELYNPSNKNSRPYTIRSGASHSRSFTRNEIKELLTALATLCRKNKYQQPLSITFCNFDHQLTIGYRPNQAKPEWVLLDANLPVTWGDEELLSQLIFLSLSCNRFHRNSFNKMAGIATFVLVSLSLYFGFILFALPPALALISPLAFLFLGLSCITLAHLTETKFTWLTADCFINEPVKQTEQEQLCHKALLSDLKLLLTEEQADFDWQMKNKDTKAGNTALLMAITEGNLQLVKKILQTTQRVYDKKTYLYYLNHLANSIHTPLNAAVFYNQMEIAKCLIDAGAEINCKNDIGTTPLRMASIFGRPEMTNLLLDHGALPPSPFDELWQLPKAKSVRPEVLYHRPLFIMIAYGDIDPLQYMLENCDIDINQPDINGETLLIAAIRCNKPEIALLIIGMGAKTEVKTKDSLSARELAQSYRLIKVVEAIDLCVSNSPVQLN